MRAEWKASCKLLNGKRCLEHRDNSNDLQIYGRSGVIIQTQKSPALFAAIIDDYRAYNHLRYELNVSTKLSKALKGEECLFKFTLEQFEAVYKAMRVPRRLVAQLQHSKRFATS